jgi:hypothetical protein
MFSLCIVHHIHVTINDIKPPSFSMETQEWVLFALLSATKYFILLSAIKRASGFHAE